MQTEKKKKGGQPGNQNAAGHGAPRGNRNAAGHRPSAPMGNTNAVTHGLNSRRILDEDEQKIIRSGMTLRLSDLLWDCILLQHAAIIRAQQIMFVTDPDDHTRQPIGHSSGEGWQEHEYEIQFAQEKQAAFLDSQSRAMTVLRTMIDLYDDLTHRSRELIELDQQLRILRIRAWIEKNNPDLEIDHGEDDFIWALTEGGKRQ